MCRAIGAIGLLLILIYVRQPLMPFIILAALSGAMIGARSRAVADPVQTR